MGVQNVGRPLYTPVINDFFVVSVSVSSSASAVAAGVGPFRGLFFKTSSSVTITMDDKSIDIDNFIKNSTLWIQGSYLSVIATATAVYGVL